MVEFLKTSSIGRAGESKSLSKVVVFPYMTPGSRERLCLTALSLKCFTQTRLIVLQQGFATESV